MLCCAAGGADHAAEDAAGKTPVALAAGKGIQALAPLFQRSMMSSPAGESRTARCLSACLPFAPLVHAQQRELHVLPPRLAAPPLRPSLCSPTKIGQSLTLLTEPPPPLVPAHLCAVLGRDLRHAAERGDAVAVQWLLQAGGAGVVNQTDSNGSTALHLAVGATSGSPVEAVRALLKAGAMPNAPRASDGRTPLHCTAAVAGAAEVVRVLVAAGGNVESEDAAGASPLCLAAEAGDAAVVEALLKAGASHEFIDPEGRAPLHFAAQHGRVAAGYQLLHAGAAVGAADIEDRTPLHSVALGWHADADRAFVKMAQMLLGAGATAGAKDASGKTAAALAAERGATKLHDVLSRAVQAEEGGGDSVETQPGACWG